MERKIFNSYYDGKKLEKWINLPIPIIFVSRYKYVGRKKHVKERKD